MNLRELISNYDESNIITNGLDEWIGDPYDVMCCLAKELINNLKEYELDELEMVNEIYTETIRCITELNDIYESNNDCFVKVEYNDSLNVYTIKNYKEEK